MKGDPKVIAHLNTVLGNELVAINQYFLHARMLKDWGYRELGDKVYHESIDEMRHADTITERILFLEGIPNFQDLGKLHIGENVKEIMESDLNHEMDARKDLVTAIEYCENTKDYVSREIFEKILESEEEHIDWIETQLNLISQLGLQNYLQTATGGIDEA
ncbi:MAG: bacterioferritin [Pseudomonadota bacterium]